MGMDALVGDPIEAALLLRPVALLDEAGSEADDLLAGAIVRCQRNLRRLRPQEALTACGEFHKVLDRRATEAVERLVVIAHHAEVPVASSQREVDPLLNRVRVLILVHDDMLEDLPCPGEAVEHGECALLEQREIGALSCAVGL